MDLLLHVWKANKFGNTHLLTGHGMVGKIIVTSLALDYTIQTPALEINLSLASKQVWLSNIVVVIIKQSTVKGPSYAFLTYTAGLYPC